MIFNSSICAQNLERDHSPLKPLICFNASSSPSFRAQNEVYVFELEVDDRYPRATCQRVNDTIALASDSGPFCVAPQEAISLAFDIQRSSTDTLAYWAGTAGSFGFAYPTLMPSMTVFHLLQSGSIPAILGLDLNAATGASSQLDLGGVSSTHLASIQWGEKSPHRLHAGVFHQFPLFHLSLCGVDLLEPYSSYWWAVVDTGSSCLALPPKLFHMVERWLGLECTEVTDSRGVQCWLPVSASEVDPEELPYFSFQTGEDSEPLYVPIHSLLLPDPTPPPSPEDHDLQGGSHADFATFADEVPSLPGSRQLCIVRDDPVSDSMPLSISNNFITIGTLPLTYLYTALDMRHHRVGFSNKWHPPATPEASAEPSPASSPHSTPLVGSNHQPQPVCAARAKCIGDQRYVPAMNECADPPCELTFWHYVDPGTKTCKLSSAVQVVGVVLAVLLCTAELVLLRIRARLTATVASHFA